ncbi:MAG: UvrD-helicase domain-containing protein [Bifidobacteriaceae bacterium]|nr:UvrD-helicase domain-containing protein [Bifidobacteriaceae bacterium]
MQINKILTGLNDRQLEAVTYPGKALLIVAGAGSGKTRVLTHRIAYLVDSGELRRGSTLAITFTNKAANELRTRLNTLFEDNSARYIWANTFHAACLRILRANYKEAGLSSSFSIYDRHDSMKVVRDIMHELYIDSKRFPAGMFLEHISSAKNQMTDVDGLDISYYIKEKAQPVYDLYQLKLAQNNALDFDDILLRVVELLKSNDDVRNYYREKFKHVFVDEYQDTNKVQLQLIRELVSDKVTVVGDSDQSIYAFRGATIRNIIEFSKDFPEAEIIKLEQNYRSTQNILSAANDIIKENPDRIEKNLFSKNDEGEKIGLYMAENDHEEATFVVQTIYNTEVNKNKKFKDFAVFYRTNAQSRAIEEALIKNGVPYQMVGTKFYERKEIKDVIAYLTLIENPNDDVAFLRIINTPRRKLGETTQGEIVRFATERKCSCFDALETMLTEGRTANRHLKKFYNTLIALQKIAKESFDGKNQDVPKILDAVLTDTGYLEMLRTSTDPKDATRIENLSELENVAGDYYREKFLFETFEDDLENDDDDNLTGTRTLRGFLEQISLFSDTDEAEEYDPNDEGKVTLMTLHAAKGLEFPIVFITGFEQGLFPHKQSLNSPEMVEEERRLAYVGVTRAMEKLYITMAIERNIWGKPAHSRLSPFAEDIPEELINPIKTNRTYMSRHDDFSYSDEPVGYSVHGSYGRKLVQNDDSSANSSPLFSYSKPIIPASRFKKPKDKPKVTVNPETLKLKKGDKIMHDLYGEGKVLKVEDESLRKTATILFDTAGKKRILLRIAPIVKL